MRRLLARPVMVFVAVGAMLLAGCGDDEEISMTDDSGTTEAADLDTKPEVGLYLPAERGEGPSTLVTEDLVVGDGTEAVAGSAVTVHYVGVSWSSGGQFDASWDRGQPFGFELGAGRVIAGWDQGVEGMRVGGRRVLTIPPELAYGDRGAGGVIGPNETLVFVVDLLAVDPPAGS